MKNIDSINLDEIEKIKEGQRLITDKFKTPFNFNQNI